MKGDEFIREVDEAVRQDRWLSLWKTYGAYVVGAVLAIVVGTAAGVGWRQWQESSRLADAERFATGTRLLESDRPEEAADAFMELVRDGDGGYAVLARLRLAEAGERRGDEAARNEALEGLAQDDEAGELYRELSTLLVLQDTIGQLAPERALAELEPLTEGPWRYSALELKALVQMEAAAEVEARETLALLVGDPGTPPGIGRRAAELLQSLGGPVRDLDADGADPAGGSS